MNNEELSDLEIAPASVVLRAARDFASALAETPQFREFEACAEQLQNDEAAQKAIRAFQEKQRSLQLMLMLNAVSPEDQAELERLRQEFISQPTVIAYFQAQAALTAICQMAGEMISQSIGINYASACGSGCCG